jgi:SAM-dependent methyltransferase
MKQNIYDDQDFFANYSKMPRSVGGLNSAEEWPAFCALLPNLVDKRVLDLGCGFGWHCRYARQQRSRFVLGVDLSNRMLAKARALTNDSGIEYLESTIEDVEFQDGDFDVVISSLALHYIQHFDVVCRKIHRCLTLGGTFVFSVEHPVFTSRAEQDWHVGHGGERLHWPIDNYQKEGIRHTQWMADDVIKYHRTVATYVNTLIESGFQISKLLEPGVSTKRIIERPDLKDERRRPIFLVIAAQKNSEIA